MEGSPPIYKNKVPNRVTNAAIPTIPEVKRVLAPLLAAKVLIARGVVAVVDEVTAWLPPTGRTVEESADVVCWGLATNGVLDHWIDK